MFGHHLPAVGKGNFEWSSCWLLVNHGVPSITKIWVAPESAIALPVASQMPPLQSQILQYAQLHELYTIL
jgi:hypothetical protein